MRAVRAETPARELFRDAAFPASDSSLFYNLSTPLAQFREDITWRRPQEICATPQLFPDNPWEGQVKQGLLGDCWFLCACAALQKSQHLLDQVFPPGQPGWSDQKYRGLFTCRIWQFGRWEEVTIDDRLPCLAGRLCFSRCQREDVFWLPLLEKAYAKVHGSYEHLWAGQVADALVDLTGSLAERWSLKDIVKAGGQQDRASGGGHRTCRQLLRLKDQCLISCSVLSPRAGTATAPHVSMSQRRESALERLPWLCVLLASLLQRQVTLVLLDWSFHVGKAGPTWRPLLLTGSLEAVARTASELTTPSSVPQLLTKQSPKPFCLIDILRKSLCTK